LPDGRQLIVGLRNGTLVKIDADTGNTLQRNEQLQKSAYTYSICTTPELVFCGCRDGLIRIYDHSLTLRQAWKSGTKSVRSLVVDQRHNRVFAGSIDGSIVMFNLSGQRLSQMIGHDQAAASLAVSPDGRTLASGGGDSQICIWDTATNEQQLVLRGHRDAITDLCFSADGLTLWSTSADGDCYRWTGTSQQAISNLAAYSQ
jgi:WD40 repeat protein